MISLVTRFMDRLAFIKQALPTWLKVKEYSEIIIVDWSSKKEDVLPFLISLKDPRLKLIRVSGQEFFNNGAAWNVGIRAATGYYINAVDCDILIKKSILEKFNPEHNCFYNYHDSCRKKEGFPGTCIFPKYMWESVDGYVEQLKSWGQDDISFFDKLSKRGFIRIPFFDERVMHHINHSNDLRRLNFEDRCDDVVCDCKGWCLCKTRKGIEKNDITLKNLPPVEMGAYASETYDYAGNKVNEISVKKALDTCIITTFYNPVASNNRLRNFSIFSDFIKKSGMEEHLYTCEVLKTGQVSLIEGKNIYRVVNDSVLWHKESAINYVLKRLPESYKKVIIVDCDIVFQDKGWVEKIEESLNDYIMVQPFGEVSHLKSSLLTEKFKLYSFIRKAVDPNMPELEGGLLDWTSPGHVTAYNRDYLDHVGGFFDKCLLGGGDAVNIYPFLNDYMADEVKKLFKYTFEDLREELSEYYLRGLRFIENSSKKSCSFIGIEIAHLYHGSLANRMYEKRYDIINGRNFDEFLYRRGDGFFEFKDVDSPLQEEFKGYFIGRKE